LESLEHNVYPMEHNIEKWFLQRGLSTLF
jgi:hypothetical protein